MIGQPAEREKVVRFIERETIGRVQAFAGQDFGGDWLQALVGDL